MSQDIKETLEDETNILVNRIIEQGIDAIIGGFPCQDISLAGKGKGIQGGGTLNAVTRSGLFWEMVQTVCMVRPKYWLMENVAAILNRGMGDVLGAVATCGYDAEWDCVGSGTVGAPHHRARTYILANDGCKRGERVFPEQIQRQPEFSWCENVRGLEELRSRPDLYPPQLCGGGVRVAERLHGIGNGNPPCVIRELTKNLD